MKLHVFIIITLFTGFWVPHLRANIYSWTDKDGVVHYTNYNPPKGAKIVLKAPEFVQVEDTLQELDETNDPDSYLTEIKKIVEQQSIIAERQQTIKDQLDALNRKSELVIEQSQDLLDEAKPIIGGRTDFRNHGSKDFTHASHNRSYISYGSIPYYPYHRYRSNIRHGGFRYRHFKYYRYDKRHFSHRKDHYYRHLIRRHPGHFSKHHGRKFFHGSRNYGFGGKSYYYKRNFRGSHRFEGHFRGGHRFKGNFRGGHRGFRGGRR